MQPGYWPVFNKSLSFPHHILADCLQFESTSRDQQIPSSSQTAPLL